MILVFIDETSDSKFKDYLGFCIAVINSRFYPLIKRNAQEILSDIGWDPLVEFKGSYLFSISKGCPDIDVERRIDAAHRLLDLNIASSNSRMSFTYGRMSSELHNIDYLEALPGLLYHALPRPDKTAHKNLVYISCDERSGLSIDDIHDALAPIVIERNFILLERVALTRSSVNTVGLMFADLVGYLEGRVDTISNDSELFEGLSQEQFERSSKIRKLISSQELIAKIKNLDILSHESMGNNAP